MAEQSFKSPGFFEREIELISETEDVIGTPAGIIGASEYGPAFVPVTVGTFKDFQSRFGSLKAEYYAPSAVNEWLKNRTALTYVRVLGVKVTIDTSSIFSIFLSPCSEYNKSP